MTILQVYSFDSQTLKNLMINDKKKLLKKGFRCVQGTNLSIRIKSSYYTSSIQDGHVMVVRFECSDILKDK